MASRGMRHTYRLHHAYTDPDTIERIHEQLPDAPVIAKTVYRDSLARTVAEVPASSRMAGTPDAIAGR